MELGSRADPKLGTKHHGGSIRSWGTSRVLEPRCLGFLGFLYLMTGDLSSLGLRVNICKVGVTIVPPLQGLVSRCMVRAQQSPRHVVGTLGSNSPFLLSL